MIAQSVSDGVKPTFLVIGAQKCGTTWLSRMLIQHSEITVSDKKELHFFNKTNNFSRGIDWYENQFTTTATTKAVGEFTPNYFWTSDDEKEIAESGRTRNIPALIHKSYPNLKLILLLRNPVDRAISAYFHHIRVGRLLPRQRILDVKHHFGIETMGYYDIHLESWTKYFDLNQFLILFYETDIADRNKLLSLRRTCDHIGVSNCFEPKSLLERYNVRDSDFELRIRHLPDRARSLLKRVLPRPAQHSSFWAITVTDAEKQTLREIYAPHNERLFQLLGENSVWPA